MWLRRVVEGEVVPEGIIGVAFCLLVRKIRFRRSTQSTVGLACLDGLWALLLRKIKSWFTMESMAGFYVRMCEMRIEICLARSA